jgi:hypothetical protein
VYGYQQHPKEKALSGDTEGFGLWIGLPVVVEVHHEQSRDCVDDSREGFDQLNTENGSLTATIHRLLSGETARLRLSRFAFSTSCWYLLVI